MPKKKYIETPEELWNLFTEYRDEKKSDPIMVVDFVGKDATKVFKPHQRPLTLEGFSSWLFEKQIIKNVWHYFTNADGKYDEYLDICRAIKEIIRTDQIEGGMVGIYNPSITQRLNGLTEKSQQTVIQEQPLFGDE
ncbi:terminase small subunit [Flagellimonas sp. CMM7]|uniref:terminase small subunit n=1 Tax=Flagellimonas sp. CMM7 TaxID=2654676 RepID=UPI0013D5764A|nr:terminase small subunit [Flagellimonas sp. CMM7]UII80012.1 DNA-packaging protein [Flagellimonas sp. CMM7]